MQAKHTKMKNVEYSELKIKEYFLLPGIKVDEAKNIFKFRTRMSIGCQQFREIVRTF